MKKKTFEVCCNAEFEILLKADSKEDAIRLAENLAHKKMRVDGKKVTPYSIIMIEESCREREMLE